MPSGPQDVFSLAVGARPHDRLTVRISVPFHELKIDRPVAARTLRRNANGLTHLPSIAFRLGPLIEPGFRGADVAEHVGLEALLVTEN